MQTLAYLLKANEWVVGEMQMDSLTTMAEMDVARKSKFEEKT
jgi:hypothetical protein